MPDANDKVDSKLSNQAQPKSTTSGTVGSQNQYKVLDINLNDDTKKVDSIILDLEDGRMFSAGVESAELSEKGEIKKRMVATIRHDGLDNDGVPKNAVVVSAKADD